MDDVIEELYANLRETDRIELEALDTDIKELIRESVVRSGPLYIRRDTLGRLLCVYGLVDEPGASYKVVWMLGTTYLEQCPKKIDMLCKEAKFLLDEWAAVYGPLFNLVYEGSKQSLRWLTWLGVTWQEPIEYHGKLFRPFVYGGGQ